MGASLDVLAVAVRDPASKKQNGGPLRKTLDTDVSIYNGRLVGSEVSFVGFSPKIIWVLKIKLKLPGLCSN